MSLDELGVLYQLANRRPIPTNGHEGYRATLLADGRAASQAVADFREQRVRLRTELVEDEEFAEGVRKDLWLQLLKLEKGRGTPETLGFTYLEMLIPLCDEEWLWEEAFLWLEHEQNDYERVLETLRGKGSFFLHLSPRLCYYWCDLEEREDTKVEQGIYASLEQFRPEVETFIRDAQSHLRRKDLPGAKHKLDAALAAFSHSPEALAFLLLEYARVIFRKYSNDMVFPRSLLLAHLDSLPFTPAFYFSVLEFCRTCDPQKNAFDSMMAVVTAGLHKACALPPGQFQQVVQATRLHFRKTLSHIELIKLADRNLNWLLAELAH